MKKLTGFYIRAYFLFCNFCLKCNGVFLGKYFCKIKNLLYWIVYFVVLISFNAHHIFVFTILRRFGFQWSLLSLPVLVKLKYLLKFWLNLFLSSQFMENWSLLNLRRLSFIIYKASLYNTSCLTTCSIWNITTVSILKQFHSLIQNWQCIIQLEVRKSKFRNRNSTIFEYLDTTHFALKFLFVINQLDILNFRGVYLLDVVKL